MSDPSPAPLLPHYTAVNPFAVTTLPQSAALQSTCSAPASGNSSSRTSSRQPRYFAPLPPQSASSVQARQHSEPVRGAASYELDGWLSEPYVEQAYSTLYRTVRNGRASSAWKATTTSTAEFSKPTNNNNYNTQSCNTNQSTNRTSSNSTTRTHRVRHVDAWNVADGQGASIGGRHIGDRQRMSGGVEGWEASPYEASERVMAGLCSDGLRGGYRSGVCIGAGHSHPNVKVGGSGLRNEKQYHSRQSGSDGRCYHHCTGTEVRTIST